MRDYAAGAARRRQRAYIRAHSSSLSGSALTVPRTARLAGSSAASAFFNANSAARTCVLVMSAVPRAWCCRRSSKALTSIATDWRRLRGRLPRGFRDGRAGCRLRFAARGWVTAAPAVLPASCEAGRRSATRTPPCSRCPGRARRRGGRRNRPSTDLVSGPSGLLVMVSTLLKASKLVPAPAACPPKRVSAEAMWGTRQRFVDDIVAREAPPVDERAICGWTRRGVCHDYYPRVYVPTTPLIRGRRRRRLKAERGAAPAHPCLASTAPRAAPGSPRGTTTPRDSSLTG